MGALLSGVRIPELAHDEDSISDLIYDGIQ